VEHGSPSAHFQVTSSLIPTLVSEIEAEQIEADVVVDNASQGLG
jgi:hypothetical protein